MLARYATTFAIFFNLSTYQNRMYLDLSMRQEEVPAPEIVAGVGYPLYYSVYLHCAAYLLRKATAWYTGTGKLFTKDGVVNTPGLGEGCVKYSACLPMGHVHNVRPLPLVLVIEGGGFILGQPSDGERHDRLLCDKVRKF
jgi:acetyl esterase